MPSHARQDPFHRLGTYAAWRLEPTAGSSAPFDLLWTSLADLANPWPHRVFPTGEPSLAIRRRRSADGALEDADIVVCAAYDQAFWYRPAPGEELIALRLKPERSARLFAIDPRDYRNQVPSPPPKKLIARLEQTRRTIETAQADVVANALCADLLAIAAAGNADATPAERAAQRIRVKNGRLAIRSLARELEIGERCLRRRFRDLIGCGPKSYARYARLTAATVAADSQPAPDWAGIASDAGFNDQSHMIGEFVQLVGLSPARSQTERRVCAVFSNTGER